MPQHKAGLKIKYQTCSKFEIAIFLSFALKSRFDFPVPNLLFGIKPAYDAACITQDRQPYKPRSEKLLCSTVRGPHHEGGKGGAYWVGGWGACLGHSLAFKGLGGAGTSGL